MPTVTASDASLLEGYTTSESPLLQTAGSASADVRARAQLRWTSGLAPPWPPPRDWTSPSLPRSFRLARRSRTADRVRGRRDRGRADQAGARPWAQADADGAHPRGGLTRLASLGVHRYSSGFVRGEEKHSGMFSRMSLAGHRYNEGRWITKSAQRDGSGIMI